MSLFSFFTSNKKELNVLERTIEDFNKLKIKNTSFVYSSEMSVYKISSLQNNIINYTNFLRRVIDDINTNTLNITLYMSKETKDISISSFFLDNDNNYIDVEMYLNSFNKICVEFLTLCNEKNSTFDKDFNTEKNLYLSSIIINNISYICKELINATENK